MYDRYGIYSSNHSSRWRSPDAVGDTVGDTVGNTVADTVGNTVGNTVGDTVGDVAHKLWNETTSIAVEPTTFAVKIINCFNYGGKKLRQEKSLRWNATIWQLPKL